MSEPRSTDKIVAELMRAEYEIVPASIVEGPRGWVGETFIVTAVDGRCVFAKVLDVPGHFHEATAALPVLEALRAAGIENLSFPIRTKDGRLAVDFDARRLILLEFIDGSQGNRVSFDFASYVRTVARVHVAKLDLPPGVPREDYFMPVAENYVRLFEQALIDPGSTAPQQGLKEYLQAHEAETRQLWSELLALAVKCRRLDVPFVVTHSDAFEHNLLVTPEGEIFFIDWDELKLGPVERDTWYFVLNSKTRTDFLSAYRETFPTYEPHPTLCRYYLLRRYFEDIEGCLVKIMEGQSIEEQARLLAGMKGPLMDWLWPLIEGR